MAESELQAGDEVFPVVCRHTFSHFLWPPECVATGQTGVMIFASK